MSNTFRILPSTRIENTVEIEYPLYIKTSGDSYSAIISEDESIYVTASGRLLFSNPAFELEEVKTHPGRITIIPPHEFYAVARLALKRLTNIIEAIGEEVTSDTL